MTRTKLPTLPATTLPALCLTFGLCASGLTGTARADQLIQDDLIIQGNLCVGPNCIVNEAFIAGNPLELSGPGIGIFFEDTGGTSTNDWRLGINDTNEDSIYFTDMTAGSTPFKVMGNALDNTLFVGTSHRVGLGTSLPELPLHIATSSPSIRFEDTAAPTYKWEMGGFHGGFVITDRTTVRSPFIIKPSAASNSIVINDNGKIGFGVSNPLTPLHIRRSNGTAAILVEDTGSNNGNLSMLQLTNRSGRARMQFTSVGNANQTGDWSISSGLTFVLQERLEGKNVFIMDNAGNLTITGELTTAGSCDVGCDRVFDADYDLPSIAEHNAMMWDKGYLPNVGPTAEDAPFNVSDKMGRMLNELEHAHIFIGQQERRIEALSQGNTALLAQAAHQQNLIAQLAARLDMIEGRIAN